MPSWSVHKKWALKMGIHSEAAGYVDKFIDKPESFPEFKDFYSKKAGE